MTEEFTEDFTERDLAKSDADIGTYLCLVSDQEFVENSFLNVTESKYGLTIIEALAINDKEATEENKHTFAGYILEDAVPMPGANEYAWCKKKRGEVALATGLLASEGGRMGKSLWPKAVGKKVIVQWIIKMKYNKADKTWEKTDFKTIKNWKPAENNEPEIDPNDI